MNTEKNINILGGDYEFTLDISGVKEDINLNYIPSNLPDIYNKILNHELFEVSEFSLSNFTMMRDKNISDMVAIPIFINRGFRHGIIWVREDSKLESIKDLKKLKVGIKDYSQTAAVWLRGILLDEYEVHWSDIDWYANKNQRFEAPKRAKLSLLDKDPEEMVIKGELDAYIAPRTQDNLKNVGQRKLRPLLDNVIDIEKDYFYKTGIYPINHCVMIHQDTYLKYPNLGHLLFQAYSDSKKLALKRKLGSTLLPWADKQWSETMHIFNYDPYPHGLSKSNRNNIQKLLDYLFEQELITKKVSIEDIFVKESHNWTE
ncbi:MAG: hypothetical protein P8K09_01495 [Hyphomicrobiales bacterium]|nr:hypothetical protein [Hyphomicrobiales bacterium]